MTSGARKAPHRQRDDGSKPWTRCWRWCCWWWSWWSWWWWWRWCARGQSSDYDYDDEDEDDDDEEDGDDAEPLPTDSARARGWSRSRSRTPFLLLLLLFLALLSERGAQARVNRTWDRGTMGLGPEDTLLVGNSSGAAKNCLTFLDADDLCGGLWGAREGGGEWSASAADLHLSFCDSYSLLDLLDGSSSPDNLDCSAAALRAGEPGRCSRCVQAFQRYDVHALEKYEEFELMTERYVTDVYSVRTCMEECKMAYKPWLCAQYFQSNQSRCSRKVPCERYCLEVQQRCPFILPDNDDLIHGGTPSFICTGLSEKANAEQEPQCCDVRWELKSSNHSRGTFKRTHPSCQHVSSTTTAAAAASGAPRLGHGRLRLCLLVLVLLHTMATMTASQNSTCLAGIFPLEDNTPREE